MNTVRAVLREFERRILRPCVHRLRGRRPEKVVVAPEVSAEQCRERDRLEELVVALARTELRRRQAAASGDACSSDDPAMVAGQEPSDQITGLLRSLLDVDLPAAS
jgi:hypothetical protein